MKQATTWEREIQWLERGCQVIVGLDEVGRGAWAGPLVACAFMFHAVPSVIDVYDSKQLTEIERQTLAAHLPELGVYGMGEVTPEEIDLFGLQRAQYLAYERALSGLPNRPDVLLLDGRPWKNCPYQHEAIVGGDATVASIAAASIMAKVYRDTHMQTTIHNAYPEFGFASHVGYGTALHKKSLKQFGVLPIHRKSYKPIQAYLNLE